MNSTDQSDLHDALRNDPSGELREDVLARLRTLQENCVAAKRQLSDREAYKNLHAASIAVSAAIRIVESLPKTAGDGN